MKILILISLLSLSSFAIEIGKDKKIIVCAEDTGWPPFSIPPGVHKNKTKKLQGFNFDILSYIFNKHQIDFEIIIKPWKRCLHDGRVGDVHIVLDAALNKERKEDYLVTNPIYILTPIFFYSKKNSKEYNKPMTPSELDKKDIVCGQIGYTYNNFGFKNNNVKMFSKDHESIFDLVLKNRCSIGLTRKEVLLTELKHFKDANEIGFQTIKGLDQEEFFWLINKNFSYSKILKEIIDTEIKQLNESGKALEILNQYY